MGSKDTLVNIFVVHLKLPLFRVCIQNWKHLRLAYGVSARIQTWVGVVIWDIYGIEPMVVH